MQPIEDYGEDYLAWLAAAPKGVRWDRAQEMWEEYSRKRREHAELCAKRLLGKQGKRSRCPECNGDGGWCGRCLGEGEVDGR